MVLLDQKMINEEKLRNAIKSTNFDSLENKEKKENLKKMFFQIK